MKFLFCSLNTQPKPVKELMNFKGVVITLTKLIAEFRDTTKDPTPHSKWDIINSPPWYTCTFKNLLAIKILKEYT